VIGPLKQVAAFGVFAFEKETAGSVSLPLHTSRAMVRPDHQEHRAAIETSVISRLKLRNRSTIEAEFEKTRRCLSFSCMPSQTSPNPPSPKLFFPASSLRDWEYPGPIARAPAKRRLLIVRDDAFYFFTIGRARKSGGDVFKPDFADIQRLIGSLKQVWTVRDPFKFPIRHELPRIIEQQPRVSRTWPPQRQRHDPRGRCRQTEPTTSVRSAMSRIATSPPI